MGRVKAEDKYKFSSLPIWAQNRINELKNELLYEQTRVASLLPALLCADRSWFTILNPHAKEEYPNNRCGLFVLGRDQVHKVCSLYKDDILVVVRGK